jgi:hypothetical protein
MPRSINLVTPVEPRAEVIAQTVLISFAHSEGWPLTASGDLGLICSLVWQELAVAPMVSDSDWRISGGDGSIQVEVRGLPSEPSDGALDGWSSDTSARLMGRLAKARVSRDQGLRISVDVARRDA